MAGIFSTVGQYFEDLLDHHHFAVLAFRIFYNDLVDGVQEDEEGVS